VEMPEERIDSKSPEYQVPHCEVSEGEYRRRLEMLKEAMEREGIDVALIQHAMDLYYYAGTALYCFLVVPRLEEPVLLVRINLSRARQESWIRDIRATQGLGDIRDVLRELDLERGVVGMAEDVTTVAFQTRLSKAIPLVTFQDIGPTILGQRMVKSPAEIG
jgi:Xaa-Pro dipeptidase